MKSNKDEILRLYFEEKLKQVEIAKKLNISNNAVSKTLKSDSRFLKEKEQRKVQNKIKHNKEIQRRVENKRKEKSSLDLQILKVMHEQASLELSERMHLSNIAYRNWNLSVFSYNEKKKI